MSLAPEPARALLQTLDALAARHEGRVLAHGAAMLDRSTILSAAGFNGMTLAAPSAIGERLGPGATAGGAIVLSNDPHAGGADLNHLFLVANAGSPQRHCVAALAFQDFGAMRKDVFRRRPETYHEGLSLSLLSADWSGSDRDIVLGVIAANIRHGAAMRAVIDEAARAIVAAAANAAAMYPRGDPAPELIAGAGEGHVTVGEASNVAISASLRILPAAAMDDPASGVTNLQITLRLVGNGVAQIRRCAESSARSAAVLGIADALGAPWQSVLPATCVDARAICATPPEAVGDGLACAYACYRAAFTAVGDLPLAIARTPREPTGLIGRLDAS
ncbi:MAG: hypothetical protein AB7O44_28090 [Hyphomicrobiaceae bacterium]